MLRAEERALANKQHEERELVCYYDDDGSLIIHGRLAPEQGAQLMQALAAARDDLREQARVQTEGVISYHIGNWAPPIGIEYRIDMVNAFVALIVATIGAVSIPFARTSVAKEISEDSSTMPATSSGARP